MSITFKNLELISVLGESAGFKTGLTLSKDEIIDLFSIDSSFRRSLSVPDEKYIRIYPEEIDEMFAHILFKLGSVETDGCIPSTIRLHHKYKNDSNLSVIFTEIMRLWNLHLQLAMDKAMKEGREELDPTSFIIECKRKFGQVGLNISMEFINGNIDDMHRRISKIRRVNWKDTIALKELFESESLESEYGNFIDQRFIDYLQRNSDKLNEMHWRKFEGLTAEYFTREGFNVELGPGRNDGGIDVRVWKDHKKAGEPPLILIQCKRYKNKIDRTVVKALWADVEWEKAESGLIVTTSGISPGGLSDCQARGYMIKEANKTTISEWLNKMKTPGSGIFMGI
ncbi:restriction endonuclease [Providencia alcalifaciens]|uniref:Restriction endonuclease n=1 Tax=Providencia alcalifaciens DSM 30120 TaxID=520999 RepID=B6XCT5_9GAMM|nr:restriction endonuclease [Providencia alcalifaciens]ATG16707.1 restriction endonuclease [Providencia alcalifaciens]EEB46833.1 restriction endonuclease [Providencia alcalifaciens DSM 30120]SQI39417.1 Restriction endonuclease [Providencia alcalifaciens]